MLNKLHRPHCIWSKFRTTAQQIQNTLLFPDTAEAVSQCNPPPMQTDVDSGCRSTAFTQPAQSFGTAKSALLECSKMVKCHVCCSWRQHCKRSIKLHEVIYDSQLNRPNILVSSTGWSELALQKATLPGRNECTKQTDGGKKVVDSS